MPGQTPRPGMQGAHPGDDKSHSLKGDITCTFLGRISLEMQTALRWLLVLLRVCLMLKEGLNLLKEKALTSGSSDQGRTALPPAQMSSSSTVVAPPKGWEHTYSRDVPAAGILLVESDPSHHNPVALGLRLHPSFLPPVFAACTPDPWISHVSHLL